MYDMTCEFDVEQHKQHFIDYFEACIDKLGKVHYAVPSHVSFLEKEAARQNECSVREIQDMCPKSMYADYMTWLLLITGLVCVWSVGYKHVTPLTLAQKESMDLLEKEGLMIKRRIGSCWQ